MATKKEQIDFIKAVYPAAYRLYSEKDSINPVFVTAQAALETGWKVKGAGNNIFGITKGSSWQGKTELVLTTEIFNSPTVTFKEPERVVGVEPVSGGKYRYRVYRLFRSYNMLEDCLDDHINVLRGKGYADAWAYRKDAKEFARRIVDAVGPKYATGPNYASVMCSTIDTINNRINEIKANTPAMDTVFFWPL